MVTIYPNKLVIEIKAYADPYEDLENLQRGLIEVLQNSCSLKQINQDAPTEGNDYYIYDLLGELLLIQEGKVQQPLQKCIRQTEEV